MVKSIAYVGNPMHHQAMLLKISSMFDVNVSEFMYADTALEGLMSEKYDLVIMKDEVGANRLRLPQDLSLSDGCGIACLIIEKTRQDSANRHTPIIVPVVSRRLTPSERYMKAGATRCVNFGEYPNGLVEVINDVFRNYLI